MWTSLEGLKCGTCALVYLDRGERSRTLAGARAAGWHINVEEAWKPESCLCPSCIRTPRPRLVRSAPMADDQPMFELEEKKVERRRDTEHN